MVGATVTIADQYREYCETPSDIYLHLPRLVEVVRELDAKHVIELGTRSGVSTVAFLHALEETDGRLTSIDLDAPPAIESPRWTFIQGDDLDPRILYGLEPADLVFIDTSHLYEQTVAELHVYKHLVNPGGIIALHDTQLPQPIGAPRRPSFPVRTAIEDFVAEEDLYWVEFPECWGLGLISLGDRNG
jgi:predicted O-methyltransferase YrrM